MKDAPPRPDGRSNAAYSMTCRMRLAELVAEAKLPDEMVVETHLRVYLERRVLLAIEANQRR